MLIDVILVVAMNVFEYVDLFGVLEVEKQAVFAREGEQTAVDTLQMTRLGKKNLPVAAHLRNELIHVAVIVVLTAVGHKVGGDAATGFQARRRHQRLSFLVKIFDRE